MTGPFCWAIKDDCIIGIPDKVCVKNSFSAKQNGHMMSYDLLGLTMFMEHEIGSGDLKSENVFCSQAD